MHFFPSRNITMYMAKLFIIRSFAVLTMLVLILMTLDLLGESGKILAVPGNDQGDVLHYVSMRAPQIIARFLPFSALLGTLIAFAGLSQNSEVVAMKAAGLSAHQILAPMFHPIVTREIMCGCVRAMILLTRAMWLDQAMTLCLKMSVFICAQMADYGKS